MFDQVNKVKKKSERSKEDAVVLLCASAQVGS